MFDYGAAATLPMSVTVPGVGSQTVQLELTAAQSGVLIGAIRFAVVATLADGSVVTLALAGMTVNFL